MVSIIIGIVVRLIRKEGNWEVWLGLKYLSQNCNVMKVRIRRVVIVEGCYMEGILDWLEEDGGKGQEEVVEEVEKEYGYDGDKDDVGLDLKSMEEIKDQFEVVEIESEEVRGKGFKRGLYQIGIGVMLVVLVNW